MNMQKPSDAQIVQAFDALSSENARPLQTLLYLNATQYHHVQDPKTGKSMVHVAIENDRLALASLLIQKKFPVNVIDGQGQTPLHLAKTPQGLALVLQAAGDEVGDMVGAQDFHGNLSHHALAKQGAQQALAYFLQVVRNPSLLLRPNKDGDTVLHLMAQNTPFLVGKTVSTGLDVRRKNAKGQTAEDLCSDPKVKKLLRAHAALKNRAEDHAKRMLIQQVNTEHKLTAARKALTFLDAVQPAMAQAEIR